MKKQKMQNNFYVVLPSNSSHDYYPDNTLTNFKTRLPIEVDLTGEWCVGLAEIQYPYNWVSFERSDNVSFGIADATEMMEVHWHDFFIPPALYADKGELIAPIQEVMRKHPKIKKGNLSWDKNTDVVTIDLRDSDVFIRFTRKLKELLGFTDFGSEYYGDVIYQTHAPGTLLKPITALYVYSDVVQPRIVGDARVSLLRTVPVLGEYGKTIYRSFQDIHYVPILLNSFQNLEVNLNTDTGDYVPFQSGRVVVTLHFKRV